MSVCMHHHHQGLITNKVFNIIIGYASSKCIRHVIIKVYIHLNIQSQNSAHPQSSRFCSCWDFKLSESTITQSIITAKLNIIQPYQLILRSANQKSAYVKTLLMPSKALNLLSLSCQGCHDLCHCTAECHVKSSFSSRPSSLQFFSKNSLKYDFDIVQESTQEHSQINFL